MALDRRTLTPELLDELAPEHPDALRSRCDLRKVHRAMGSLRILKREFHALGLPRMPRKILELGAGDGSLLLRFAHSMRPAFGGVQVTFLDRHDLISERMRSQFAALDWTLEVWRGDVMDWARNQTNVRYDLCVTTLFLHHFDDDQLALLLRGVAAGTDAFIACEPERSGAAWAGSHLIGVLGVNRVTREDAVKSVAAGFRNAEISALWPSGPRTWRTHECWSLPFTHCFRAISQTP